MDRDISRCVCPLCKSRAAHLRLSAKGLAYLICNACNLQAFARSAQSDAYLRELALPAGAPALPEAATAPPPPARVAPPPAAPAPPAGTDAPRAPRELPTWGAFPWLR